MKMRTLFVIFCALLILSGTAIAQDDDDDDIKTVDVRVGIGVSYSAGFQDVADYYKERYGAEDSITIPVGFAFNLAVQIRHNKYIASAPGFGVGPVGLVWISGGADETYLDIPLTGFYSVKFLPDYSVGPYFRAGIASHLAYGDAVLSRSPGLFIAGGIDLLQKKGVNLGIEISYDKSTVTFNNYEEIKTGDLNASFRVIF